MFEDDGDDEKRGESVRIGGVEGADVMSPLP